MEALVLASILSCADGQWIMEGVVRANGLTPVQRIELIQELRTAMPEECELLPPRRYPDESTR